MRPCHVAERRHRAGHQPFAEGPARRLDDQRIRVGQGPFECRVDRYRTAVDGGGFLRGPAADDGGRVGERGDDVVGTEGGQATERP